MKYSKKGSYTTDPMPFYPKAPHHAYIGAFIIFMAALMSQAAWPLWSYIAAFAVGAGILIDDVWEHKVSRHTPLRWFFERVMLPILGGERSG